MIRAQNLLTAAAAWLVPAEPSPTPPITGEVQENSPNEGPPPLRLATKLSLMFSHTPAEGEKQRDSNWVQYGFGAAFAGAYGIACEIIPQADALHGLIFGAALWLTGDEGVAPRLGIADPPDQTPVREKLKDAIGHLVYGVTAEQVRRALRS